MYTIDDPTFLLALLILLALSIATVEWCRADKLRFSSDTERLFLGDNKLHSFASNLGSLFSVTYFFGATIIYGHIYGTWLFLVATAVLIVSFFIIRKVLDKIEALPPPIRREPSNILLDLYRESLQPGDLKVVLGIYLAIYFGLLVEELAVARLLLTSLFPATPALVAIVLTIITFCVLLYLYVGGFRAVLKSDVVQLAILLPFILSLIFLMNRPGSPSRLLDFQLEIDGDLAIAALVLSFFFGVAWFISSVDIFARFNFREEQSRRTVERKKLLTATFISFAALLAIGMAFGSYLEGELPKIATPLDYFRLATAFFVHNESELIAVVTLLSLYSMIFTTVDALLLNLLQIGHYAQGSFWKRNHLLAILAVAAFLSSILDLNSLGAIGIFLGSLLILPALVLLSIVFGRRDAAATFSRKFQFLPWVGGVSALAFFLYFDYFRLPFERQLLIPGLVLACLLVGLLAARAATAFRSILDRG